MATNSSQETIFGAGFSPLRGEPTMGSIPIPDLTITSTVASTGSGAITLTAAQIIGGFLIVDCQDAQNAAMPTAELLIAAIPGVKVGSSFQFQIKNSGDSTLTVVLGTGVTVTGTATVITAEQKQFLVYITNATVGSATYTVYCGLHSTF
jgi:hypothetical protein